MNTSFLFFGKFCESQVNNHFIKEPVNLITSLLFIVAAIAIYRLLIKTQNHSKPIFIVLLTLVVMVGIGNFLMHLLPNPYFYILDIVSLLTFFSVGIFYSIFIKHISTKEIAFIILLVLLSSIFKYLDTKLCHFIPFGTHFLLHISIPLAMYKLMSFLNR